MRGPNTPESFTLDRALDEDDARSAARAASNVGAMAEQDRVRAAEALAEAERGYRKALAVAITDKHGAGVAWTVCADLARGEPNVADLRYVRDVARGVLDAAEQRAFRLQADRRSLHALTEWSMKQALMLGPIVPEPAATPIGRRAA